MYLRYYRFQDYPFAVTPDPAYLYLSAHHREALGHLLYGTGEHGGFVALTGEVGTGKTTLIRALLEQDQPQLDVALCLNPKLTVHELVAEICDELGVARATDPPATVKAMVDALNAHLLATHASDRRTVLIVDEAQNLDRDVLEQLRLLTNLETRKHKLMRIILVGQPELDELLQRPDLRQLAQRITARCFLQPLDRRETGAYIGHRLEVAGGDPTLFTARGARAVYGASGGIPRLINTVCERALMGGYAQGRPVIGAGLVRRAAREALPPARPGRRAWLPAAGVALAAVAAFAAYQGARFWAETAVLPAPATATTPLPLAAAPPDPEASKPEAGTAAPTRQLASEPEAKTVAAPAPASESPPQPEPVATAAASQPRPEAAAKPAAVTAAAPPAAEPPVISGGPAAPEPPPFPAGDARFSQLLRLWGIFGQPHGVDCANLRLGALHCLHERGDLADLARFGRPARLALEQDGQRAWVILTGLGEEQAALIVADGTRLWPRALLAERWTGEYELVWRLQAPIRRVQPGSVGAGVAWVRERLARAAGKNLDHRAGRPSPVYDPALEQAVRRFQAENDSRVDGVVGARTMILLNGLDPAPGTPSLEFTGQGQG